MRTLMMVLAAVAALSCAAVAGRAEAQSACEINRLNQAIQVCNSPAGSTLPECARLRGQLGATPAPAGVVGGSTAGLLGGLLGQVMSARAAPPAPVQNTAGLQQGVAACVRNAAGDQSAIQVCLAAASRPAPAATSFAGNGFAPAAAPPVPGGASAGIFSAGQSYQACVAADQVNWRRCLPLLNGGAAVR